MEYINTKKVPIRAPCDKMPKQYFFFTHNSFSKERVALYTLNERQLDACSNDKYVTSNVIKLITATTKCQYLDYNNIINEYSVAGGLLSVYYIMIEQANQKKRKYEQIETNDDDDGDAFMEPDIDHFEIDVDYKPPEKRPKFIENDKNDLVRMLNKNLHI